mgnify:CR=1 FL=1|jgi:hypothetical protein
MTNLRQQIKYRFRIGRGQEPIFRVQIVPIEASTQYDTPIRNPINTPIFAGWG